jgi:DNA-binding XRE family transcriptional regulator
MGRREAGKALWEWRDALGLTQTEAAALFGVKQPTYCDWENGRKCPGEDSRETIELKTDGQVPDSIWPRPQKRPVGKRVIRSTRVASDRTSLSR